MSDTTFNPTPLTGVFNEITPPDQVMGNDPYLGNGYFAPQADNSSNLENVAKFQVGQGSKTVKMDEQGIWTGGDLFEDAAISLSVNGVLKLKEGTIIVNDGVNDRIIIGKQDGGF